MRLSGRRIVVTGAASGIGKTISGIFRHEGAGVALIDRNAPLVATAATEVGGIGIPADVSRPDEVEPAVKEAAGKLGGLDGVVNCAAIDLMADFADTSASAWQEVLAINLTGPFLVCNAALPFLEAAAGGTIVNIASAAGLRPLPRRTAYCSAKAGLVMFSKALAIDVAPKNIRVNAVCPGITRTPQLQEELDSFTDPEREMQELLDLYLIKRIAAPEEIAAAVLFLTSGESSYMTGAALAVDGGRSFH